jgi:hypothetical protein
MAHWWDVEQTKVTICAVTAVIGGVRYLLNCESPSSLATKTVENFFNRRIRLGGRTEGSERNPRYQRHQLVSFLLFLPSPACRSIPDLSTTWRSGWKGGKNQARLPLAVMARTAYRARRIDMLGLSMQPVKRDELSVLSLPVSH